MQCEAPSEGFLVAAMLARHLRDEPTPNTDQNVATRFDTIQKRHRPLQQDARPHKLAQRGVIGASRGISGGKVVRRVETEPDDRNTLLFKDRHDFRANPNSIFHRMFAVASCTPKVK